MKKEYDFAKAKRGAVVSQKGKTRISIYIDNDANDSWPIVAADEGIIDLWADQWTRFTQLYHDGLSFGVGAMVDNPAGVSASGGWANGHRRLEGL